MTYALPLIRTTGIRFIVSVDDRNFYVDDLISGGNEFEEALQTSRRAKNIMEVAGMDLRKWITNDANLMEQWKKENFNVHPVHKTVSLGANETKVLGLSWNTNEDYLTTDTKSLLEFVPLDKNTKHFTRQKLIVSQDLSFQRSVFKLAPDPWPKPYDPVEAETTTVRKSHRKMKT
ncbi:integrase catalytic domain-containing protein [Trichonephila clavipes]|nr:integrase catalytic domain-containing protein [Trichonephila clavipes]